MRGIAIYLDLNLPCVFADESHSYFADYLDDQIASLRISEFTSDDVTITLDKITQSGLLDELQVSLLIEGLVGDEYSNISEEEFIETYRDTFDTYISYTLIPEINEFFAKDPVLGYLPNANVAFIDDRLYVEISPRQDKLELDLSPAVAEYTEDVDDLISDLYYTED